MATSKPTASLPTELISEKSFYTLGGASAGVLLTCWAINYVAVDVSWLNYKTYRLIGVLLSEAFAVYIMYKTKKKDSMKWLFAFLNGLLIFVNASGLNVMTSSYIFSTADSTANTALRYQQQYPGAGSIQLAGIFPLPRMISWWPDEKLIAKNQELVEKTKTLDSANTELKTQLKNTDDVRTGTFLRQKDSLQLEINSLTEQLNGKQKQIDDLILSAQGSTNTLQQKLTECIKERDKKNDALISCQTSNRNLTIKNQDLQSKLNDCNDELSKSNGDKDQLSNRVNDLTQQLSASRSNQQSTLTDLQTKLNNCNNELSKCNREKNSLNSRINELTQQLATNSGNQTSLADLQAKLTDCNNELSKCNREKNSLNSRINELAQQLTANSGAQQSTLTDLLKQVCQKTQSVSRRLSTVGITASQDDQLRQQGFYKEMNWAGFCKAFNSWLNPVIIK